MQPGIVTVHGVVVRGYRVASQKSKDYPYGTIDKQKPVFKELDLDLERFYSGTLNISIARSEEHTSELKSPCVRKII
jgi:hypothetical protein